MWSPQQLEQYREQGYLAQPGLLSTEDLAPLLEANDKLLDHYGSVPDATGDGEDGVHYVKESNGAVRSLFAAHRQTEAYRQTLRSPKIAGPMKQIFENDAYVFHSKLNVKESFKGAVWLWHQDYGYWQFDGMDDRMASVLIMLDKTTIYSGCILFIPGSHKWGVLDHYSDEKTTTYKQWCVTTDVLKGRLKDDNDYIPVIGEPGDVFFFDCNMLHGSGHNMSATSRRTLIFACADIDNRPKPVENPRPDWVVDREFEAFTSSAQLASGC